MKRMNDGFIDLTVTSPPYDNLRDYKGYSFDFEAIAKELYRVTKIGGVVVWVVSDATVNGSETGTSFKQALYFKEVGFNLHDTMIWEKRCPPMNAQRYEPAFEYMFVLSKGKPAIFNGIRTTRISSDINREKQYHREKDGRKKYNKVKILPVDVLETNIWKIDNRDISDHPAIFPEKLVKRHIYTWTNKGDLIYDPFTGSGTTMKMAHLQDRNWIGSEISPEYVELANKRIKPYLDQLTIF